MEKERQSAPARLSRSKSFLFSATITLLVLITATIIAEIYLRKKTEPEFPFYNAIYPYVMFRPRSDRVFIDKRPSLSSRNKERAKIITNVDSFRVPSLNYPLEKAKPEGQLRIAVIGGSTVQGGTTYEVTLPGALKRALQARYPNKDIEVINAGIVSAIARQELVHFLLTVVDYEPDILITYDGINDTGIMLHFEHRYNFPYNWHVMETAWNRFMLDYKEPWWKLILSRSEIVQKIFPQFAAQKALNKKLPFELIINSPERRKKYVDAYLDNWEKIFHVCKGYDIAPIFLLQPTSLYGDEKFKQYRKELPDWEQVNYAHKLLYDDSRVAVAEFAKKHPDAIVSDMSDFLLDTSLFYDGCHVYDEVNDIIAEGIVKLVVPLLDSQGNLALTSKISR